MSYRPTCRRPNGIVISIPGASPWLRRSWSKWAGPGIADVRARCNNLHQACGILILAGCVAMAARAQQSAAPDITQAWGDVLQGAQAPPDAALSVPQAPAEHRAAADLRDHFFMETRTEFWRDQTYFTGL